MRQPDKLESTLLRFSSSFSGCRISSPYWAGIGLARSPWLCTVNPLPRKEVSCMPHAGSSGFKWGEISIVGKRSHHAVPLHTVLFGFGEKIIRKASSMKFLLQFEKEKRTTQSRRERKNDFSKSQRKHPTNERNKVEAQQTYLKKCGVTVVVLMSASADDR